MDKHSALAIGKKISKEDEKYHQYLLLSKEVLVSRLLEAESELAYVQNEESPVCLKEQLDQARLECNQLRLSLARITSSQSREKAIDKGISRDLHRRIQRLRKYLSDKVILSNDEINAIERNAIT